MLTLGTKTPQLRMFKLDDKGGCMMREGGREKEKEGKRGGGRESGGKGS